MTNTTKPALSAAPVETWKCAARKQSLPEPADCGWPTCGCDPHADKVIAALEEQGHAAPVAQEPVIWQTDLSLMPKDREFLVKMSDGHYHVARFIGAEKKSMIVGGAFGFDRTEKIVAWRDINTNPPATSAGLGAEKLRELASCLDRALGDTDPSINPDYTDDEIKRDYPVFWVCQQLNAILALLSRAGDQSNSTHEA